MRVNFVNFYSPLLLSCMMPNIFKYVWAVDFCFDGNNEGRRLNYTVLRHLHANSGPECIFMCLTEDECCRSVNYRKKPVCCEETNCEILHGVAAQEPGLLIEDVNYDNYVLLQPQRVSTTFSCHDPSCLNGGKCVGRCRDRTTFCDCTFPHTGKYCNDSNCHAALCFHGNNIDEYGVAEGPAEALSNFTACFWAKAMPHNLPITSILSYAYTEGTTVESDGLLVHVTEKLELKIEFTIPAGLNVKPISTDVHLTEGKLEHVCVTRQSSNGMFNVYHNGKPQPNNDWPVPGKGKNLPGGGVWIIGQEQDELGGGFNADQAFGGELTEINVWDRVLSESEITELASSCTSLDTQGNYLAYRDFNITGNVEKFKPSCCK